MENKQLIIEKLAFFGLSKDESQLYLYLLEKGPKTPLRLSREMNINRTKTYRLLEKLEKKKLIEESLSERGKRFKAAPPENLKLIINALETKLASSLEEKKVALPDIVSTLSQLPTNTRIGFEIRHYKGIDGLKQMTWNELKAKEVLLYSLVSIDILGKGFADKHREEVAVRNIPYKEIGNLPAEKIVHVDLYNKTAGKKVYEYRRVSANLVKIRHGIAIYDDTVAIYNSEDKEYVGIEIINKPFAETQRQNFQHFWKLAK